MASRVAARAACLWKILNIRKLQPVAQRNILFLPANIQARGKFAKEITPVRPAIYRHSCALVFGML